MSQQAHLAMTSPNDGWNLPVELYQEIFRIVAVEPLTDNWDPYNDLGSGGRERIVALYQIAGACRQWRAICLATPVLWTFIRVAGPDLEQPERLKRVYSHLERSGTQPLHVVIDLGNTREHIDVFSRIAQHAHRWRFVGLFLSPSTRDSQELADFSVFASPMPQLEELQIRTRDEWKTAALVQELRRFDYLPHSPRLRRLVTHALCIPPSQPAPELRFLSLSFREESDECLWKVLALASALVELHLYYGRDGRQYDYEDNDPPPVMLKLRRLHVHGLCNTAQRFSKLHAPRLETLCVPVDWGAVYAPLFRAVASTIRHLVYTTEERIRPGYMISTDSRALVLLDQIETLELLNLGISTLRENSFFEYLCSRSRSGAWCWPNLRRITLNNCVFRLTTCHALLEFVQLRIEASQTEMDQSFEFDMSTSAFISSLAEDDESDDDIDKPTAAKLLKLLTGQDVLDAGMASPNKHNE